MRIPELALDYDRWHNASMLASLKIWSLLFVGGNRRASKAEKDE
jgi:hypothetical protein